MTLSRKVNHELIIASIWVLAALVITVVASIQFLSTGGLDTTTHLYAVGIGIGMWWSISKLK